MTSIINITFLRNLLDSQVVATTVINWGEKNNSFLETGVFQFGLRMHAGTHTHAHTHAHTQGCLRDNPHSLSLSTHV